jgi:phage shock protein C
MTRKIYPYSLDRHDAKIAGVCSTLGKRIGIDPTIVRIAFVAVPLLTPMPVTMALVIYALLGVYFAVQKKREVDSCGRLSDFDRMDDVVRRKPSVHAMRTELAVNDRRLRAIDHHLNSQTDELARELEALRQEGK